MRKERKERKEGRKEGRRPQPLQAVHNAPSHISETTLFSRLNWGRRIHRQGVEQNLAKNGSGCACAEKQITYLDVTLDSKLSDGNRTEEEAAAAARLQNKAAADPKLEDEEAAEEEYEVTRFLSLCAAPPPDLSQ